MSQTFSKLLPALVCFLALGNACSDDPEPTPADTGVTPTDSGVQDVGFADSGLIDTGTSMDAGNTDVGNGDTGNGDSGTNDTGMPVDSGDSDGGSVGDGGPVSDGGPAGDGGTLACDPGFDMATACGGDPRGSWTYVAACSDTDFFAPFRQVCPTLSISNQVFSAGGTISVTGTSTAGTYARNHTAEVTAEVLIPTACTSNCAAIQLYINNLQGYNATCPLIAAGCDCRVSRSVFFADMGTWSAASGLLTVDNGAAVFEFDYCVAGASMMYRGNASNTQDHDYVYLLGP